MREGSSYLFSVVSPPLTPASVAFISSLTLGHACMPLSNNSLSSISHSSPLSACVQLTYWSISSLFTLVFLFLLSLPLALLPRNPPFELFLELFLSPPPFLILRFLHLYALLFALFHLFCVLLVLSVCPLAMRGMNVEKILSKNITGRSYGHRLVKFKTT